MKSRATSEHQISRRRFLQLAGSTFLLPSVGFALPQGDSSREALTMGVIADLHHGLAPDAMSRLEVFMDAVAQLKPDAILNLGDFNYGTPQALECKILWEEFRGRKYHVLGNHDLDKTTKKRVMNSWSMKERYYSFDLGGFHFIVLDRNNLKTPKGYVPYAEDNYNQFDEKFRDYADPKQLEWLEADLKKAQLPVVVFVHQGLGVQPQSEARGQIEGIFQKANSDGKSKVIACFCGHQHVDRYAFKHGLHYVWLNSASYVWVGPEYGNLASYKDSLFSFIKFHENGLIEIEGRKSDWKSPSPQERGFPQAKTLTPYISDRQLKFG